MKYKILRFLSFSSGGSRSASAADYFRRLPVLETPSLILRPMVMKDAADIYAYSSDPEVARYVLWEPHRSLRETRMYIRYIRSLYQNGLPSSWAVVLRETGRVIGSIGFMWLSEENSSAEVGYSLSRQYWNRGYATEALSAVLSVNCVYYRYLVYPPHYQQREQYHYRYCSDYRCHADKYHKPAGRKYAVWSEHIDEYAR